MSSTLKSGRLKGLEKWRNTAFNFGPPLGNVVAHCFSVLHAVVNYGIGNDEEVVYALESLERERDHARSRDRERDSPLHKLIYGMTEGLETMIKTIREERMVLLDEREMYPSGVSTTSNNDAHFSSLLMSKEETTPQAPVLLTVREEVIDPSFDQSRTYAAAIRSQPPVALVAPTVVPPPETMAFDHELSDFDPDRIKRDETPDDDDIIILDDAEVAAAAAAKAARVAPPAALKEPSDGTPMIPAAAASMSSAAVASDAGTLEEYFLPADPTAPEATPPTPATQLVLFPESSVILDDGGLRSHITASVECPNCGEFFMNQTGLSVHVNRIHKRKHTVVECPHCDECFLNHETLDAHVSMTHKSSGPSSSLASEGDIAVHGRLECDHCGEFFAGRAGLNRHASRMHKVTFGVECSHPGVECTNHAGDRKRKRRRSIWDNDASDADDDDEDFVVRKRKEVTLSSSTMSVGDSIRTRLRRRTTEQTTARQMHNIEGIPNNVDGTADCYECVKCGDKYDEVAKLLLHWQAEPSHVEIEIWKS